MNAKELAIIAAQDVRTEPTPRFVARIRDTATACRRWIPAFDSDPDTRVGWWTILGTVERLRPFSD